MTWKQVTPWRPGPEAEHIRHDLANVLLPLAMAADTLETLTPPAERNAVLDLLGDAIRVSSMRFQAWSLLLEEIEHFPLVSTTSFVAALGLAGKFPGHLHADVQSLRHAARELGTVLAAGVQGDKVQVDFGADPARAGAYACDEPGQPYVVRGVRFSLALAAHVVGAHSGVVRLSECGSVQWILPLHSSA